MVYEGVVTGSLGDVLYPNKLRAKWAYINHYEMSYVDMYMYLIVNLHVYIYVYV